MLTPRAGFSPAFCHQGEIQDEWLLFKKLPEYATRKKRKNSEVTQLLLPGFDKSQPQAM